MIYVMLLSEAIRIWDFNVVEMCDTFAYIMGLGIEGMKVFFLHRKKIRFEV